MSISKSEEYMMNFLHRRFNVHLAKIPEGINASPDYVFMNDQQKQIGVAELKDIEYYPPSEDRGWVIPKYGEPHYPFAHRDDNAVLRVANKIHEAYRQLKKSSLPRVIIFLNHDTLVDIKDLDEAFTGGHLYGNETFSYVNTVSMKIANGRIKNEKKKIDLYIWIDKRTEKVFFRYPTQIGHDLAHDLFKKNDKLIVEGN